MKSGAGGHVENAMSPTLFEFPNEKITLAICAGLPVDKFISFVDKSADIFILVFIGLADFGGKFSIILL